MGNALLGMIIVLGGLVTHQFEAIIVKEYGTRRGKGGMFFNAVLCLSATIYFFVSDTGGFILPRGVLAYGLVNSTMYAVGFYSAYVAYSAGSFGLTRLLTSFGGIITILYGIIVLKEPVSPLMLIAMVLVFVSVFLVKYEKNSDEEKTKFSFKWILSVILIIVSNALISIISKMQHSAFSDTYKNEYLIVTFLGSAFWLIVMGFIFERDSFKFTLRHGLLFGFGAGIFNGITNVLTIVSYNFFPLSFLSPVKTGLSMTLGFLVSTVIYKETFTRRQIIGVVLGVLSAILMNL